MIPTNGKARPGDVVAALKATKECATVASSTTSRRTRRLRELRAIVLAGTLVLAACGPEPQTSDAIPTGGEWREFQGTWTAAGSRRTMRLGSDRQASIADLNGSLVLSGPSRPAGAMSARS